MMIVRMMHVAVMVAVLGVVVMIVGVVVHPVHRFILRACGDSRRILGPLLVVRCVTETAKAHRQECLCYQWEV